MGRIAVLCLTLGAGVLMAPAAAPAQPKLGVVVVVDQLRDEDIRRYRPLFGKDGFGGLDGGKAARFVAEYQHATTETAVGHATLATGAAPSVHGIVANRWFANGKVHYATKDSKSKVHGSAKKGGRGPGALEAPTLIDSLEAHTLGAAKTVAISIKDRAAIFSGGRAADVVLWYDRHQGRFTSSTAYGPKLPKWADHSGRGLPAASMKTGTWRPKPVPSSARHLVGADAAKHEWPPKGWTDRFPHDLKGMKDQKALRGAYAYTPQAMADLFELGRRALDAEQMGADDVPDLLVISVSTIDYIGHSFGSTSVESIDALRRLDDELRAFIEHLTKKVGPKGFAFALTSDHGGCVPAAKLEKLGLKTGYVEDDRLARAARSGLEKVLGKRGARRVRIESVLPHIHVDVETIPAGKRDKALSSVRAALAAERGIAAAYRTDRGRLPNDGFAELVENSLYGDRHGVVYVRLAPYFIPRRVGRPEAGNHGTPNLYDRRIPLLMRGPGLKAGRYARPVDARDLAPTMAHLLRVPPPALSQGRIVPAVTE